MYIYRTSDFKPFTGWRKHYLLQIFFIDAGFGEEKKNKEAILVVGDSQLQFNGDQEETQLVCSPSTVLTTDVAAETLRKVERHEENLKTMASNGEAGNKHVNF